MAATAKKKSPAPDPDYMALIATHPLMAIRSDEDHGKAVDAMTRLILSPCQRPGEIAYRDALAVIIEHYESSIYPEPVVSPAALLRFLMESANVTQVQVADGTGISQSTISDLLSGRRPPSRRAARLLGEFFKVDPSGFF